ncbi:ribonuclease PH [Thermopirellula anaerolimosa]
MAVVRADGRRADELRPCLMQSDFVGSALGSVFVAAGRTKILCTVSIEEQVPAWLAGSGKGWLTAEYNMLPGSTQPRKPRDRFRADGRAAEIQRLIGRSLRAVVDLTALGERTLTVDCDVLEADGGTRVWSINGACAALIAGVRRFWGQEGRDRFPIRENVVSVSVVLQDGSLLLDPCRDEDSAAAVDFNIVMTGSGRLIEVQATGEKSTFDEETLAKTLNLAKGAVRRISDVQRECLGADWPWD